MTAANHALTGALIGTVIHQPIVALGLAFASHFFCDALPHFDIGFKFGKKSMYLYLFFDGFAALLFAALLISQDVANPAWLAVCGFAAMSPDLMWLYYGICNGSHDVGKKGILARFHSKIQWSATKWGIVPELIWASLMITAILKLQ